MKLPSLRSLSTIFSLALLLAALAFVIVFVYEHTPNRGLPYGDAFAKGKADEWKAFGGTWELANGMMRNDSDERGAKLLTGSPYWHNYSIEGDIYLLGGSGDAGLLIRSTNGEEGVNAYDGYYAGVRTIDNALVLGRARHSWMETTRESPVPGGIHPFHWYHIKLLAYECQIVVSVGLSSHAPQTTFGVTDSDCIRSGQAGLRSYSSGGIWRNIVMRPATQQDVTTLLAQGGNSGQADSSDLGMQNFEFVQSKRLMEEQQALAHSSAATQSIASLRMSSFARPATATIRGVVILTAPRVYVQDATGGVYIPGPVTSPLKVGDEVEATGEVLPGDFSSTMRHTTIRVLWARTPMPPVSVTASQASTGKYDATFIEVYGTLTGKEHGSGNTLVLNLNDGPQSFRAILNPGRSDALFNRLKLNSRLRLRGICVIDSALTSNLTPFVLLLRSNEDLDIIAGPPWWSTGHIVAILVATLVLALIGVLLYHRIENWRLRSILEERERLAHEIHDTLAQSFAGIGFQLQAIGNGFTDDMTDLRQQLDLARNLVRHSHEEARRSIATLRTEDLESEDLLTALKNCANRMVEGGSLQIIAGQSGNSRSIPLRISATLYRIGQEAVANAVRHAYPHTVTIHLDYSNDNICLTVEDDGDGFLLNNTLHGFGVRGMRRRAQSISASFHLESKPGSGTRIQVEVPLPPRASFFTSAKFVWKLAREHWFHARPAARPNPNPYRG